MSPPLSQRLASWWAWAHGEIADPTDTIRSNKLMVLVGTCFAAMAFIHLAMEIKNAPLVRGLWRGGAFFGLSLAALVLWQLWENRRDALSLVGGVAGTALVLLPSVARRHPDLAFKRDAELYLALCWLGIPLLWWAGRRAGLKWADWGLSLGDWRWWLPRAAALAALIVAGTFAAMFAFDSLQHFYPWQRIARRDPEMLRQVQIAVFLDFLGWEFLHRGLLLFALARRGDVRLAIWTQAFIFFLLHMGKPPIELMLSLPGGVIAGYFAWRSKSFVPLWLLHALQLATTNQVATWMRQGVL